MTCGCEEKYEQTGYQKRMRGRGFATYNQAQGVSVLTLIVYFICGLFGAKLSWDCNTAHGYGGLAKALFATGALVTGPNYLIAYMIYKWGTCTPAKCK